MSEALIPYRKLSGYKYQIMDKRTVKLPCSFRGLCETYWMRLYEDELIVTRGYCWDGSTCVTDKNSMRASLVHDCLYQLIRLKKLDKSYRESADKIYRHLCIEEGMSTVRANIRYTGLRWFGGKHLRIGEPQDIIYEC